MLLFFSSGLRPGYMRNVLDCLCYPPGHVIHFRYRKELIEVDSNTGKDVVSSDTSEPIKPAEGLVVYADSIDFPKEYDADDITFDFKFFPIRFVEVLRPVEHGAWSYIPLQLGPYPCYGSEAENIFTNNEFNRAILKMSHRPRRQGHSAGEGYFVKRADPTIERIVVKDDSHDLHDAWEATVSEISQTTRFQNTSLFYRVDHLFEAREVSPHLGDHVYDLVKIKPIYHSDLGQCIYNVRADVDFRLRVITHQGKKLLPILPKIKLNADPAIFTGETNGKLLVDSPYNEESLFLRSKRATESSLTAVELEAEGGPETLLAAKPRLLIKVDPMFTQYLLWIAALLASGQLLLSANQEMLTLVSITNPIWPPIAKLLGFFATLVGVGLAFRKMKIP